MTTPMFSARDLSIPLENKSEAEIAGATSYAPTSKLYRRSLMLAFIAIAFDFKSRSGGPSAIQLQMLLLFAFLTFSTIAIMTRVTTREHIEYLPRSKRYLSIWIFFLIFVGCVTFLRGMPVFDLLRIWVPYLVMCIGMVLVYRHLEANYDPQILVRNIILCLIISVLWTAYVGRSDVSYFVDDLASFLEDVRFSIVSSGLILLLAWSIYEITRGKALILNALLVLLCVTIIFVSKTRAFVMGFAFVIPYILLVRNNRSFSTLGIAIPIGFGVLGLSTVFLTFMEVDLLTAWQIRFQTAQEEILDVTLYMRFGEYIGQMKVLFSSPTNALFGMGLFYETYGDPEITGLLERTLGVDLYYASFGNGVHSTWVNSFFHGGLIAGWIPTYGFWVTAWIAMRVILLSPADREAYGDRDKAVLCMAIMPLLSMSVGSIFIHRLGTFAIGAVSIYSYIQWERWQRRRQIMAR